MLNLKQTNRNWKYYYFCWLCDPSFRVYALRASRISKLIEFENFVYRVRSAIGCVRRPCALVCCCYCYRWRYFIVIANECWVIVAHCFLFMHKLQRGRIWVKIHLTVESRVHFESIRNSTSGFDCEMLPSILPINSVFNGKTNKLIEFYWNVALDALSAILKFTRETVSDSCSIGARFVSEWISLYRIWYRFNVQKWCTAAMQLLISVQIHNYDFIT